MKDNYLVRNITFFSDCLLCPNKNDSYLFELMLPTLTTDVLQLFL